jgi:hypothetical protein
MYKLLIIAVTVAFLFVGCSDTRNPVGPDQTPSVGTTPDRGAAPMIAMGKTSSRTTSKATTESLAEPAPAPITSAKLVTAKDGGIVRLNGSYTNTAGEAVNYDLSITFRPGDLPSDQTISITIDKNTFAAKADVTFGPAGLVFNKPATLFIWGSNVDIAKQVTGVSLLYWDNGSWVKMPYSWGFYNPNFTGVVFASGAIPHFSRYAFGR